MNRLKKLLRDWHIWLGIVMALPLVVIGITTLFLAHAKSLKLDEYFISSSFFPGYISELKQNNELKTYYIDNLGNEYFGYKDGLKIKKREISEDISFFNKHEVRKIGVFNGRLIVCTKKGVFVEDNQSFTNVFKNEIWDVSIFENVVKVVAKDGFYSSLDLTSWKKIDLEVKSSQTKEVSLKKLNIDLHTGKAIFGDMYMWIWQDILAISILFFIFSGVYVWYKKKFKPQRF